MTDTKLESFVEESLRSGVSRNDTEQVLIEAGWSKDEVRSALRAYAEVDFPVPVPRPKSQLSARDAFDSSFSSSSGDLSAPCARRVTIMNVAMGTFLQCPEPPIS